MNRVLIYYSTHYSALHQQEQIAFLPSLFNKWTNHELLAQTMEECSMFGNFPCSWCELVWKRSEQQGSVKDVKSSS